MGRDRLPLIAALLGIIAAGFISVPLVALGIRTPWMDLPALILAPSNYGALVLSVATAACASIIATATGTALALWLARAEGVAGALVRAVVLVPLVLPPVVSGIALLYAYGRTGPIGGALDAWRIRIVFSTLAVVLAQVFVSLPFVVITVEGAVRSRGFRQEDAARSLGARPLRVLTTVTLPRIAPVVLLALLLAFARSIGEFGATLTFAGSLEGVTRTLPLQIYLLRESDMGHAVGMSMILVLFSLAVVVCAYARGPRSARKGQR